MRLTHVDCKAQIYKKFDQSVLTTTEHSSLSNSCRTPPQPEVRMITRAVTVTPAREPRRSSLNVMALVPFLVRVHGTEALNIA
jgi:hypothetical protein